MTKILKKTIESCKECPYMSNFYGDSMNFRWACTKNKLMIENIDVIPEWCLLSEVD